MYNFSHCISGQQANNKSQSLAAILSGKRESSKSYDRESQIVI